MLLTFQQAKQQVLQSVSTIKSLTHEKIGLFDALDRITAENVISPMNVPQFDNSAMDGYAVRLADLKQSTLLPLAGAIFAGDDISNLHWPQGTCLRIMTGAPVPNDADAVVMQEQTEKSDLGIAFLSQVKAGDNIRRTGEDVKQGSIIINKGTKLTVPTLSTLATLGMSELVVFKKLKVAILSTGNELTPIGEPLSGNGAIYDSNRFTLKLLLSKLNCEIVDLDIIADDPNQIKQALISASNQADLVITSGGVSVGDADYTKTALEELGTINFWKMAIKPGKPFAFGKIGNALFCGLPGNPVSTLVTFYQLVQPLILALSGLEDSSKDLSFKVKTATNLKKTVGRLDFQRGMLQINAQGELEVSTTGAQGSHITQSFNQANCFIVLEQERGNVAKGELVTVELFNALLK
ncbi:MULTISPECIES: molybdopterin molybdotransferase MoeA [unclassified Gilliamella]|uniref:molybdopterin molybdotransferase MoeA n=1 Tax=unclassified Gilliamella TaxID=2685620 RepID=UPI0013076A75|nr:MULTISPECIES: molybdopterin molybdotransferase MoeA [unclassified Gilliamella]MWP48931.1 molybdopterin molybdotransferase MoeA [Gilliamella sp. Lep-s35]MWP68725.1 molybdopterin molybdotransferase MoeA [Gilliamella sp. Lep-s5]MWP77202.1 molybdopterin molybdotransferase MoeA [Gilliamella sp. Lep-s21]